MNISCGLLLCIDVGEDVQQQPENLQVAPPLVANNSQVTTVHSNFVIRIVVIVLTMIITFM